MATKQYRSEVSYGVYIVLLILLAALVLIGFTAKSAPVLATIFAVIVIGFIGLPVLLYTRYTIKENVLNVRSGFIINSNIDINTIKKITKSDTIASAPALSVKARIELHYNNYDEIIISPANRQEFLDDLLRINPNIVIEV